MAHAIFEIEKESEDSVAGRLSSVVGLVRRHFICTYATHEEIQKVLAAAKERGSDWYATASDVSCCNAGLCSLLQMLLVCAVQGDRRAEYVNFIQQLSTEHQQCIVVLIEGGLSGYSAADPSVEWDHTPSPSSHQTPSKLEPLTPQNLRLALTPCSKQERRSNHDHNQNHLKALREENAALTKQLTSAKGHIAKLEVDLYGEAVTDHNENNIGGGEQENNKTVAAAVERAERAMRAEIEATKREATMRVAYEEQASKQVQKIAKLEFALANMTESASTVEALRDEVDVLRAQAGKASKLEERCEKYKKRLEEMVRYRGSKSGKSNHMDRISKSLILSIHI